MFPRLRSFLTTFLTQRERFEETLDEEMRFHIDAQTKDLVRTGVPPAEAARRARAQFGSIEALKADCRQARAPWSTGDLSSEKPLTTTSGRAGSDTASPRRQQRCAPGT